MRCVSLGGLKYPIGKWLPSQWNNYELNVFGQQLVFNEIEALIREHREEPFTLAGFSRGATLALELAERNKNVVKVYAHSCLLPKTEPLRSDIWLVFFRTIGDRAPGVFEETEEVANKYTERKAIVDFHTLPPSPFPGRKTIMEKNLARMNHQFHNALTVTKFSECLLDRKKPNLLLP